MSDYFYSLEIILWNHFMEVSDFYQGRYPTPKYLHDRDLRANEENQ